MPTAIPAPTPGRFSTTSLKGTAALTPLGDIGVDGGGYKGYGYCTAVEVLSAALQGGSFLKILLGIDKDGRKVPYHLGHVFMAVDVAAFTELDAFKKTSGDILRELRASKKMPGHDRIYTPGEMEYPTWLDRRCKGAPLTKETQKEIKTMLKEQGLENKYLFPFVSGPAK